MPDGFAARCVWPLAAELGEGPVWDARRNALWFVDILSGRIHRFDPLTEARDTFEVGGMPCFILPADDGGFVIGNIDRLQRFDGKRLTGELARLNLPPRHRLNDATVDRMGRLWFGSMDMDNAAPTGLVHIYDRGRISVAGGACIITNGPAVSGDGRTLYHADTLGGTIERFDIAARPVLADGELFARIDAADGTPDGVSIDAEDHVWVGLWQGWSARRYAPDGRLTDRIALPCANVTKVAFGGEGLRTAFITTARAGLSEAERAGQPLAGGLFACPLAVPGAPLPDVRLGE